jgi:seryl-tRNA synthetase
MNIDYALLASAVRQYKELGYEFIEVPWIVSHKSHESTASPPDGAFVIEDRGCLVGSAEQGFIEIIDELYPDRKYAAVSPCFRKNDNRDEYHQETFMKLELFSYDAHESHNYTAMIEDATKVFAHFGIPKFKLARVDSLFDDNHDIAYQGQIEMGSYGNRIIKSINMQHVINYGTGLALPRFSQVLKKHNLNQGLKEYKAINEH